VTGEKAIVAPAICRVCGWVERYWPGVWYMNSPTSSASTTSYFVGQPRFAACRLCDAPDAIMFSREDIAAFYLGGPPAVMASKGIVPRPDHQDAFVQRRPNWPDKPPGTANPSGYVVIEPA